MSNSPTRTVNYIPKYTQLEVYDRLPRAIRDAMKECVIEYDARSIELQYQRYCRSMWEGEAQQRIIDMLRNADQQFCAKGWIVHRGRKENVPSSIMSPCAVSILRESERLTK